MGTTHSNSLTTNTKTKLVYEQLSLVWPDYAILSVHQFLLVSSQALLRAINNAGGREEIIEPAVCTLRHITSRHPNAEMAQNAVRQQHGIPLLVGFLLQQCHWPLLKALIGVIRNLALCHENHTVLREQGCIPKLWQLLNRAYQDANKRSATGGPPGYIVSVEGQS